MKPEETYTLQSFINSKSQSIIDYSTLSIFTETPNIRLIASNVLHDYRTELEAYSKVINLDDEEGSYDKYYMSPMLLSYKLYGTPYLDYILMFLNKVYDVKQWTMKKVKVIKKEDLELVLSEIYKAEKDILSKINK